MKSFRTELENPVVEKDIIELEQKIRAFKSGDIDEERFRSLRLARGVYGQRQQGVQMIRIKLPYGKVSSEQLHRIADVSDKYSRGRLHITTRQDIQIHHVSLDRTPELWAELERDDITLREACGNAVRNITASATAGIDPKEAFDISPYAQAMFKFFLRNPVSQEMGRKIKIAFSSSEDDTALTYIHDLGFIPKLRTVDGKEQRGFKVLLAGGLGTQTRHADIAHEFLPEDQLLPFTEGVLRVFDRYGERSKRLKARLKFLVKDLGVDKFLELVDEERTALQFKEFAVEITPAELSLPEKEVPAVSIVDPEAFGIWKTTNVYAQKQPGLVAIGIRVSLGDFYTDKARKLADLIKNYGSNELRFSIRQNILLRNIPKASLAFFFQELEKLGFAKSGYESSVDITSCPGTDTCNLGIASSTGIARELEKVLTEEYPNYIGEEDIAIKISGCMNSCGQHMMASIGFQGMTLKSGVKIAPALQVLLGGVNQGDGKGVFADKVIKIPSKRGPEALRLLLNDFESNKILAQAFSDYYQEKGRSYFNELLKPLAETGNLTETDFIDWGHEKPYRKQIGIGECAGVLIDLVSTLLLESEEKFEDAKEALELGQWADSIYHSYTALVNTAKAALVSEGKKTNTQVGIVKDFDEILVDTGRLPLAQKLADTLYQIKEYPPSEFFANTYLVEAIAFYKKVDVYRLKQVQDEKDNKS